MSDDISEQDENYWQQLALKTLDSARPDAVEQRKSKGYRTARENLADLCDPESFVEYGQLVVAAQRQRRTMEELRANTPADGIVTGLATINADQFGTNSRSNRYLDSTRRPGLSRPSFSKPTELIPAYFETTICTNR